MENILKLDILNYNMKISQLTEQELINLVLSDEFINASDPIINCTFSRSNDNVKKYFFINEKLLLRLLNSILNQKSKMNIVDIKNQELMIQNIKPFIELSSKNFINVLKTIDESVYYKFLNNLNEYVYDNEIKSDNQTINQIKNIYLNNDINKVKNYLKDKFNIKDESLLNNMSYIFLNRKRNLFELYRLETYEQLYIYNKYNIVVSKKLFNEENQEKYNISLELLDKLKTKHILRIINELKKKEKNIESDMLFITSIKLYCIFGIDNALKVINDKFTYNTDASVGRAGRFEFNYNRRLYRLTHPNEFFSFEVTEKLKKAIQNNEIGPLRKIVSNSSTVYIKNLFNELKENYKLYKNDDRILGYFNETVKNEIVLREQKLKSLYVADYYQKNMNKRDKITCSELFKIFGEYDVFNTKFDENNNVIMDKELKAFLLDNEKSDKTNAALIRMVFNNQALAYNTELVNIINNYDKIMQLKEENKLKTKNSLLDTLDIYKTLQYKLNYDELDMPLAIISKTFLSKRHLNVSEEESLNNLKRIYKKQKRKVSSTIPRVKGSMKNGYRYKILDKNDPEILTCGIDVGSCFKPGGMGKHFFEYALTSKYADVIAIWDDENKMYICPIVRNGNGVYGNGIDPEKIDSDKLPFVIDTLKRCYQDIIKNSNINEKIDFCTLTDLNGHISRDNGFKEINIEKPPMIGESFYCDIIKNDITNYVVVGSSEKIEKYIPEIEFYIPRSNKYVYSKIQQENRLLIEQKINEIEYSSIDTCPYSDVVKQQLKKEYKKINVDDFKYIVCNKDWYIGVQDNLEIKGTILPYDDRAKEEYINELKNIKTHYKTITTLESPKTR